MRRSSEKWPAHLVCKLSPDCGETNANEKKFGKMTRIFCFQALFPDRNETNANKKKFEKMASASSLQNTMRSAVWPARLVCELSPRDVITLASS